MEKFADVLQQALDNLGVTVQYMWPKAVYYTVISAACDMLGWVVIGGVAFATGRALLNRATFRNTKTQYDDECTGLLRAGGITLTVAALVISVLAIFSNLPVFFAPEWATIKSLIQK